MVTTTPNFGYCNKTIPILESLNMLSLGFKLNWSSFFKFFTYLSSGKITVNLPSQLTQRSISMKVETLELWLVRPLLGTKRTSSISVVYNWEVSGYFEVSRHFGQKNYTWKFIKISELSKEFHEEFLNFFTYSFLTKMFTPQNFPIPPIVYYRRTPQENILIPTNYILSTHTFTTLQ